MNVRILKFGGSSLAGVDLIESAAERVHQVVEGRLRPIVVVSAVAGTTNRLLSTARRIHPDPPGDELDRLLATGETQSASLLAMALHKRGLEARSFTGAEAGIVTDGVHGRARVQRVDTTRLRVSLEAGEIPVVAGFQGATQEGRVTTLGRGGTDITAAVLGVHFSAERIIYFRDADGVYSADPKLLPVAGQRIERLDFESMLELAEAGVPILHPQALEIARAHGLELELRSFRGEAGGTLVCEGPWPSPLAVWSVCLSHPICMLTLEGLPRDIETLARVAALLDRTDLPLDAEIHTTARGLCLKIQAPDTDGPTLHAQISDFLREESELETTLQRGCRRVTLVGTGVTSLKASKAVEQASAKLGPPLATFCGSHHRAYVVSEADGSAWLTSLHQSLIRP
jgi:aspartate kinase